MQNQPFVKVPLDKTQTFLKKFLDQTDFYCPFCGQILKEYKSNSDKETCKCKNCKSIFKSPEIWFTEEFVKRYKEQMEITFFKKTTVTITPIEE